MVAASGCLKKETKKSSSTTTNNNNAGSTTGSSTTGSTSGGWWTSGSTSGSTTSSTSGGTVTGGPSSNVLYFNVVMSGAVGSWSVGEIPPGISSDPNSNDYVLGDFIPLNASNVPFFESDVRFKVKVKTLSEPVFSNNSKNSDGSWKRICFDRSVGLALPSKKYTKLSYQVGIRDICQVGSSYYLSGIYGQKTVSQVSVNSYSPVLDWSTGNFPARNTTCASGTLVGHSVAVFNVMSNVQCQVSPGNTSYCPMAPHPNTACWNVQVELATDNTADF